MLFWPLKTNVSLLNSVDSAHPTIDQSIFPCPQVGYLQFCVLLPTVPCLWQDPLSEATDPQVLLSETKKTRIQMSRAQFRQSHCSDMQSSCGHAYTASADKWELHIHDSGWTRQVWMCSLVVSRVDGDLTWRSRDRFPVPGSSQAASDSCPAICTLHQTQLYWVCMHLPYFNIW